MLYTEIFKQIGFLAIFLALSLPVYYIPGKLLLRFCKHKFRADEEILLSYSLGIVLGLLSFSLFSLIKLWLIYPFFLVVINVLVIRKNGLEHLESFKILFKQKLLMFLLILGTLVEGFINFPSGMHYQLGDLYWSAQGHDGLWHVAVVQAIQKSFPPQNILFSGTGVIYNYHYFIDVVFASFYKMFPFFSIKDLYFRDFSFLISFLMGLSTYSFLRTWQKKHVVGLWGIFFTYFVGSFGYIVLLIQRRGFLGGETVFWAAQGNTIIGNPPHAICFVLVPAFFLSCHYYLQKSNIWNLVYMLLLGGALIGFKVSAAVIVIAGLLVSTIWSAVKLRNNKLFLPTILIILSNLFLFKIITKNGESFLQFLPWWFVRTAIVDPSRTNWIDIELRRQFYVAQGGIRGNLRVIEYELIAFCVYLFGNLGMRFVGFGEIIKSIFTKSLFNEPIRIMLLASMLSGFVITLLFVQRGVTYNLIQFMQYFLLIFGFWGAISLSNLLQKIKARIIRVGLVMLFVLLSVPTVIGNLKEFYGPGTNPLAIVTNNEIEALNFVIKTIPEGDVILSQPLIPYQNKIYDRQPWPIMAWVSTGYVSAYTGKQTYLADDGQLAILGLNIDARKLQVYTFFNINPSSEEEKWMLLNTKVSDNIKVNYKNRDNLLPEYRLTFLRNENIRYLYLRKDALGVRGQQNIIDLGLLKIFENEEIVIYRV